MFTSFNAVRRIVSGCGYLESLGDEIKSISGKKALVITDPGIKAAGLLDVMAKALESSNIPYTIKEGSTMQQRKVKLCSSAGLHYTIFFAKTLSGICLPTIFIANMLFLMLVTRIAFSAPLFQIDVTSGGQSYSQSYDNADGLVSEKIKDDTKIKRNVLTNLKMGLSYLISNGSQGFTVNFGYVF